MASIPPTKLRANLYGVLDQIIDSGQPVTVERRGRKLRIVLVPERGKLGSLPRRPRAIKGDPEAIVHLDWSGEWQP